MEDDVGSWGMVKIVSSSSSSSECRYIPLHDHVALIGSGEQCAVRLSGDFCPTHASVSWDASQNSSATLKLLCSRGGVVQVDPLDEDAEETLSMQSSEVDFIVRRGCSLRFKEKNDSETPPVELLLSVNAGLPSDRYQFLEVLGQGSQAEVKLARRRVDGKLFAAKVFHKHTLLGKGKTVGEALMECTDIERNVLGELRHPNIVTLYETFETPHHMVLVLDLCSGGDLFDLIEKRSAQQSDGVPFTIAEARHIFRQCAAAVAYLHR